MRITKALKEARYLIDRGYPKDSAVRFVSNHHRLPEADRFILMRVIVKSDVAWIRRQKALGLEDLKNHAIFVDGYNVLITTESLIGGYPVYLCDDGFLRDTRGLYRSYKTSPLTVPALTWILELLFKAQPARTEVLLDQQMSLSGELAERIRRMMDQESLPGTARTARDVDHQLKAAGKTVLTSDGNVIDSIDLVCDLPSEVAEKSGIKPLWFRY